MSQTTLPPDWNKVTLENIVKEFISGGTPSTKQLDYWDGEIPWTTSAQISEGDLFLKSGQRFITKEGLENSASHLVPRGSLLVGTRVGVGKAVVNLIDIAISQDLTGVVLNTTQVDESFLAYQFKTERVQKFFDGRKRGTTIKGISRFDLASLTLFLPSLPEQRAIARVLRAVQKSRELCQKQLALERQLKAALMQRLFTRGIVVNGSEQRKTPFGKVPARWKEKALSECAFVQTGVAKGRKLGESRTVTVPYLRVANVQDGYLDLSEIKQISIRVFEVTRYQLHQGDVVLTEGGDFDKLGRGFIWNGEVPNCVHQNHVFAVRANREALQPEFLTY